MSFEDKKLLKPDCRVVEYKLVPTGKVYNSLGEEIE